MLFSTSSIFSLSNFTQSKVFEAGAEQGVVVGAVENAVVDVHTTSTVKLAKRTSSPYSLSLLLTPIPVTPTRRFIKVGVAMMAMTNSRLSKLPP